MKKYTKEDLLLDLWIAIGITYIVGLALGVKLNDFVRVVCPN